MSNDIRRSGNKLSVIVISSFLIIVFLAALSGIVSRSNPEMGQFVFTAAIVVGALCVIGIGLYSWKLGTKIGKELRKKG